MLFRRDTVRAIAPVVGSTDRVDPSWDSQLVDSLLARRVPVAGLVPR